MADSTKSKSWAKKGLYTGFSRDRCFKIPAPRNRAELVVGGAHCRGETVLGTRSISPFERRMYASVAANPASDYSCCNGRAIIATIVALGRYVLKPMLLEAPDDCYGASETLFGFGQPFQNMRTIGVGLCRSRRSNGSTASP